MLDLMSRYSVRIRESRPFRSNHLKMFMWLHVGDFFSIGFFIEELKRYKWSRNSIEEHEKKIHISKLGQNLDPLVNFYEYTK